MPWLQISLATEASVTQRVSAALLEIGALSVTLGDAADQPIYEPGPEETPLWDQTQVTGLFEATVDVPMIKHRLAGLLGKGWGGLLRIEILEDQTWERAWRAYFQPMGFGRRLWVAPSQQRLENPGSDAVILRLDPGLAFGTGTHPSTALCLAWLDQARLQGAEVIDYGCGSGILGIAALLLGARHTWGVDNDPQALLATRDNGAKNGLAAALSVALPEGFPDIQADVVLANILANPLIELAPRLAACTRRRGEIVLSGLLANQAEDVANAYRPYFNLGEPAEKEGWVRLVGSRH